MTRNELIDTLSSNFIPSRLQEVDQDFLDYEKERATNEDLTLILTGLNRNIKFPQNPHNSMILYLIGSTDEFNFELGRSDTVGGAPPDIDVDFEAEGRDRVYDWLVDNWGRDNIAQIGTVGTFGPKSMTRRYFKLTEPDPEGLTDYQVGEAKRAHYGVRDEVLKKIPDPKFGREATLDEIIEGNSKKGYDANPVLAEAERFEGWRGFADKIQGMVANNGVHAGGVVISDFPINDHVPIWKNSKYERITQFDMGEVEGLGLLKFDFLIIKNGDIIKQAFKLVRENHGVDIDPDNVPDGDPLAYQLFAGGYMAGIFQFETSSVIRDASMKAIPTSIEELSDLTALIRPGPVQAGFLDRYLNQEPDPELPREVQEFWGETRGVLVYQEQLMQMFQKFCGWDLQLADNVRRAVGKKKPKLMAKFEVKFKEDFQKIGGFSAEQAKYMWGWKDQQGQPHGVIMGCADYLFNKSHSVAYSYVSYVCAFLKANYPQEFFSALMSVRSKSLGAADWSEKAPQYVLEAKELGVHIQPPSVQNSGAGFTIQEENVYFGFNAIKDVGKGAARTVIRARGKKPFVDIHDFLSRVNTQAKYQALPGPRQSRGFRSHGLYS